MELSLEILSPILPEIFMAVSGLLLLVIGVFNGDRATGGVSAAVMAIAVAAGILLLGQDDWARAVLPGGMFVMDQFAGILKLLILIGLVMSIALSIRAMRDDGIARFEYPILMLFSAVGMMMMVSAHNLLGLYMALELQSLAAYVLASIRRDNIRSSEAGLKYFVLGSISSGILLFGSSLVYGYAGSIDFTVIGDALMRGLDDGVAPGVLIGMAFVIAGLAFKISAAPFHMWTPDVYEGAPTPVTAFFAMVPKIAAIGLLTRLLFEAFPAVIGQWTQIVWMISVLSMTVGAFAALQQENIKRLLAYSSIGNMGYALIGLAVGTEEGLTGMIVYLAIYMVMTAGTFGLVLSMRRDGKGLEQVADLSGLSRHNPAAAYGIAVLMFSMSGIPPLAGFFSKFMIFNAAVGEGMYGLAVFGVLTSVVASYYYLRIIKVMFFDEPVPAFDRGTPFARRAVVAFSLFIVLAFVFSPSPLVEISRDAASVFFNG